MISSDINNSMGDILEKTPILSSSPELIITSSSSSYTLDSNQKKRHHSIITNESGDHEPSSVIDGEADILDYKNKKPLEYDAELEAQNKDDADSISNLSDVCDYNLEDEDYNDDDYYEYDDDMMDYNCSYNIESQFEDMDLPPGVEATVPWLAQEKPESSRRKPDVVLEEDIDIRYKSFKKFDTVEGCEDHHFVKEEVKKPSKEWTKKIQQDWKLLENDLPDTIFVRAYESRMDLLRAVIIGPAGTPYHDGLFFFDFHFPANYPFAPPKAHYHSGGLRLNPNLYACGKVCLSLLGTWAGQGCEKWDPNVSTMLQVLVSIQALVLNEKPYFNEPGYEVSMNTTNGRNQALAYNETTYIYSCKTMMYSLRNPPKHFEDYVAGHFRKHGHAILVASRAYLDKAVVGNANEEQKKEAESKGSSAGCSRSFKVQLKQLFEDLLMEFAVKGADCKEFFSQKVKVGDATAMPVKDL